MSDHDPKLDMNKFAEIALINAFKCDECEHIHESDDLDNTETYHCRKCKEDIPDGGDECSTCGKPGKKIGDVRCTKCAHPKLTTIEAFHCARCGENFEDDFEDHVKDCFKVELLDVVEPLIENDAEETTSLKCPECEEWVPKDEFKEHLEEDQCHEASGHTEDVLTEIREALEKQKAAADKMKKAKEREAKRLVEEASKSCEACKKAPIEILTDAKRGAGVCKPCCEAKNKALGFAPIEDTTIIVVVDEPGKKIDLESPSGEEKKS